MTFASHWFLFLFALCTNFLELGFVSFCIVASVITEFQALRNFSDTLILRASEDRWLSVMFEWFSARGRARVCWLRKSSNSNIFPSVCVTGASPSCRNLLWKHGSLFLTGPFMVLMQFLCLDVSVFIHINTFNIHVPCNKSNLSVSHTSVLSLLLSHSLLLCAEWYNKSLHIQSSIWHQGGERTILL